MPDAIQPPAESAEVETFDHQATYSPEDDKIRLYFAYRIPKEEAPGGRLVSLCYDGAVQNRNLRPMATTWEVLPVGSFKCEGTGAGVVMLSIDKKAQ